MLSKISMIDNKQIKLTLNLRTLHFSPKIFIPYINICSIYYYEIHFLKTRFLSIKNKICIEKDILI